ncbi:hypothetical protein LIER_34267 [Lithospermum erythrorhizon]|uniref:Uncharacterized protein n=1 Tax=Lithospermum erythrorhizon TaxID=34254 RepID=A0AAV3S2K0_LITER
MMTDDGSTSGISSPKLSDKGKATENTLSPLKRQMSQMAIAPESSSKRQLRIIPSSENTQDEDSTVAGGPETTTFDD